MKHAVQLSLEEKNEIKAILKQIVGVSGLSKIVSKQKWDSICEKVLRAFAQRKIGNFSQSFKSAHFQKCLKILEKK